MEERRKNKDELTQELEALQARIRELEQAAAHAGKTLADLQGRESWFRVFFETAKDAILHVDADTGLIVDVNLAMLDLSGYARGELLGRRLWEIGPFRGIDAALVTFQELKSRDLIRYDDLPFRTKNGSNLTVEFSCSRHAHADEQVIQCTIRDITSRRGLEDQLWKAESRFKALFTHAAIGIAVMDLDGAIVDNNRQLEDMLGYRENELRGKNSTDLALPEDAAADADLNRELLDGRRDSYQATRRCLRKDGTLIWGLVNASLVRGVRNEPQFIIRTVDDISEQKMAENALQESEERFRQIAENIKEVFWMCTPDYSRVLYVSPAYEEIWGCPCAGLSEKPLSWVDTIHPDDRAAVSASLAQDESYKAEYRIIRPDGALRWINDRGFPLKDAAGRVYRIVGIAEDITMRRQAEEAVRESEEKIRLILNSTGEAIYGIDPQGNCTFCNPAGLRMLGYTRQDELIGQNMHSLIHHSRRDGTPYPAEACRLMQAVFQGVGVHFDDEILWRADGSSFPAEVLSFPQLRNGSVVGAVVAFTDITERKQAEEALRASEARFHDLAELLPQGVYEADATGRVTYANRQAIEAFGYAADEVAGLPLLRTVVPQDRPRVQEAIARILAGESGHGKEYTALRKDGGTFPVLIFSAPIVVGGRTEGLRGVFIDLTERKRAEETLRKTSEEINDLYNNAPCGYHSLDESGTFVRINDTELSWLGYDRSEIIGRKKFGDLITAESLKVFERNFPIFKERGWVRDLEFAMVRKDGTIMQVLVNATAIRDASGALVMSRSTIYDITDRKKAERELWESRQLLQNVLDLLPVGVWITDGNGTIVTGNPAAKKIWAGQKFVGVERYGEYKAWWADTGKLIQPEEWAGARAVRRGETSLDEVIDIECFDGTKKTILNSALPIRDPHGNIMSAIIVNQDITERRRAEEALSRSESTLRSFYESAPVMMGVVELSDGGEIIHIYDNPATARFFSVPQTAEKPAGDLGAPSEAIREWVVRYQRSWEEQRPVRFEYLHNAPTGPLWLSATVSPIGHGPSGRRRFSYIAEDVTERKRAEEKIREAYEMLKIQASTDALTGIYNRLKFTDFLELEMREAERYRHPLSLIMFDVDHFKRINDTYGHLVGDGVLKEIARIIAEHIRHADVFARWGGEEFMILAPYSESEHTRRLAEKMRSLIECREFPSVPARVTCSFGVTQYAPTDTVESFTNRVDGALYQAKEAGRNRVVATDPPSLAA